MMETFWTVGVVAALAGNLMILVMTLALARELAVLLARLGPSVARSAGPEGPDLGTDLTDVLEVDDIFGAHRSFASTPIPRSLFLIFTRSSCRGCMELLPHASAFVRAYRDTADVWLVHESRIDMDDKVWHDLVEAGATLVDTPGLRKTFGVSVSPFAVHVSPGGRVIAKGIVNTVEQIESLLATTEVVLANDRHASFASGGVRQ